MRYRLLGNSGLRVSEAALGTMTFGEDWGWVPQGRSPQGLQHLPRGWRQFHRHRERLHNGSSESFLGEFMLDHRQSVVLATKYSNAFPE